MSKEYTILELRMFRNLNILRDFDEKQLLAETLHQELFFKTKTNSAFVYANTLMDKNRHHEQYFRRTQICIK